MWDGSVCDLLTDAEAIEVDRAHKWPEAVGQALYYACMTDRRPGIILLTKDAKEDLRFLLRCRTVCTRCGIKLYVEQW